MLKRFGFLLSLSLLFVLLSAFVGAVQAQSSDLLPLTEPGPYGVGLVRMQFVDPSREDWSLWTAIWYPADKTDGKTLRNSLALRGNPPPDRSGAPYPLIIFSHGYGGNNTQLSLVMEYLASQGYVVAAPQHHDTFPTRFEAVDRPLDILLVLNQLAAISEDDLAGMIDTDNVGLIGYSLGATSVLQLLGMVRDPANLANWCSQHPEVTTWDCNPPPMVGHPDFDLITAYRAQLGLQTRSDGTWAPFGDERVHAVLALAPGLFQLTTDGMLAAVTTPTMILHGTQDLTNGYEGNAVRTYSQLGTDDRYLVSIVEQGHDVFTSIQNLPLYFAVTFFGEYLKGDETYAPYLTAEHLPTFDRVTLAWGPYEGE